MFKLTDSSCPRIVKPYKGLGIWCCMYGNWIYLNAQISSVLGLVSHIGFKGLLLYVWKLEIFRLTDSSCSWIAKPCRV